MGVGLRLTSGTLRVSRRERRGGLCFGVAVLEDGGTGSEEGGGENGRVLAPPHGVRAPGRLRRLCDGVAPKPGEWL